MKNKLLLVAAIGILFSSGLHAQNMSNIQFINEIADKDKTTFSDGILFLMLIAGKNPKSFEDSIKTLNQDGITEGITLEKDSSLKRGALALMLARHLKLSDSLLYVIFKSERYAYRACIADDVMSYDGSEWDTISGGELIEIMTKASEMTGGNE